jgi:broad specificity phosphatase PhoE
LSTTEFYRALYTGVMVTITYFVHGTTPDNENGLATGWLPGELSPLGLEQAKVLAKQVADREFDIVICSDLYRAVQTAQLLFGDKHPNYPRRSPA